MRLDAHINCDGCLPRMPQQDSVISGSSARVRFALAPAGATRERDLKSGAAQPIDACDGAIECAGPTLFLVPLFRVVVEADAKRQLIAVAVAQSKQPGEHAGPHHRL